MARDLFYEKVGVEYSLYENKITQEPEEESPSTKKILIKTLSYSVEADGYIIKNAGVPWIDQRGFIPPTYIDPNDNSYERSAQLNIEEILNSEIDAEKEVKTTETLEVEVTSLNTKLNDMNNIIIDMMMSGTGEPII